MTNEKWLRWAIARHFRNKGYNVEMKHIKVGNAEIDGEVSSARWKIALEIKSGHDDVIRGLGQLAEAKAWGYDSAVLVTSLRTARRIDAVVFNKLGFVLLGIDSRSHVHQVYP